MERVVSRITGITEPCWAVLPEDKRFFWKFFSRGISLVAACFISKTHHVIIDWSLTALTALFLLLVIETQRSYSRFSPRLRKNCVRGAIAMGSGAVAIFGVALIAQVGAGVILGAFNDMLINGLPRQANDFTRVMTLAIFVIASSVAVMRVTRQIGFEELIYHLPRNSLKKVFIYDRPKATSFPMFACIELSVLVVTFLYASSVADLARTFVQLI
jgi:hypothetical protein